MLVSMKDILNDAREKHYSIPAFDVSNYEMMKAVLDVCEEERAPALLMGLGVDLTGRGLQLIPSMIREASRFYSVPVCLHLDHATDFELIRAAVDKTSPQIITLRKILDQPDFTGMAFIGVRASESLARNEYDYISLGEKHKGQYSCNPILEWNTAELYCYTYFRNLYINEAYKKGNRRAGCLVCPRAAERNEYMARVCYPAEFNKLISTIHDVYKPNFTSEKKLNEFMANGGWKARKNGRDIAIGINYQEKTDSHFGCGKKRNSQVIYKRIR